MPAFIDLTAPSAAPSKFAADNYIIKHVARGLMAKVLLFIPRDRANAILAGQASLQSQVDILATLRGEIQAVKIVELCGDNLATEIRLTESLARQFGSRHITQIFSKPTSTDQLHTVPWYTMPVYGPTLRDFVLLHWNLGASRTPVALAWHICSQLISTLLFVNFNIQDDGSKARVWPKIIHGDIHDRNLLFRYGPGAFRDYPDIVLIDFGNAEEFSAEKAEKFAACHAYDLQGALVHCLRVFGSRQSGIGETGLAGELSDELRLLGRGQQGEVDSPENTQRRMSRFVAIAHRKREELYEPLGEMFQAFFSKPAVSDTELMENFFWV
nr:hypothetical protein CFP56_21118 [Quercus suber]